MVVDERRHVGLLGKLGVRVINRMAPFIDNHVAMLREKTARRTVRQLPRRRRSVTSLTEQLMHEQPSLHGEAELWGLAWEALAYIERTVQPGMATLETGAGASTIDLRRRAAPSTRR